MLSSGISYHQGYRFETWGDEPRVVGTVYKQSAGGWIAIRKPLGAALLLGGEGAEPDRDTMSGERSSGPGS